MMEAKSRSSSVGGVAVVAQKEVKATTVECGVGSSSSSQFPPQQPMIPPHYFPPHQHQYHPPGHFPGFPAYPPPPMMPYPQMYGYHQYPPHMMRPPHHNVLMPPAFAKPATSASAIQAISSMKDTPNKTEAKEDDVSARESKTLEQKNSLPIKPTVSTETSVSGSLSDTKPVGVFEEKKIETVIKPQVSLESEPDATVSKQQSKNWGINDLATNNGHALKETQHHITVDHQEGILPFTSQKKLEINLPSSSPPEMEEVAEKSQREIEAHPQKDDSTTSSSNAIDEKEEKKSEAKLDDIDDFNAIQCDDTTNRQVLEGVESLLLLSEVAASRKPSEEDEPKNNMDSIPGQPSEQSKPLKKRKLQLPMHADRMEEGPLPKRMPPSPQRTPAFFQFLLHNRESIEQAISSYGDTSCYGLERSEMVAKEGAMWWLALAEDEKQRWADLSTQKYLGLLS
jgi:hypothetical protein